MKAYRIAAFTVVLGLAWSVTNAQEPPLPAGAPTSSPYTYSYTYPYYGGYYTEYPEAGGWYYDFYRPRVITTTVTPITTQAVPNTVPPKSGVTHPVRNTPAARGAVAQQVSGAVLRIKKVDVQGTDDHEQVLAALVSTKQDRRVIVDLGPIQKLTGEGLRVQRGTDIQARGWFSRLGHQRVFIANQVTVGDRTVSISRQGVSPQRLEKETKSITREGAETTKSEANDHTPAVEGKITLAHEVTLPGLNPKWMVALVKGKDGQRYLVNLGPENKLRSLNLGKGDSVVLQGPTVKVDGEKLLLAERVTANGHTIHSHEQGQPVQAENKEVNGQVLATRWFVLPGSSHKWLLAQVKDNQGRSFIVNFGPDQEKNKLDLTQGDKVTVQGESLLFHGQRFLLARRAQAHGQTVQLNQEG